MRVFVETVKDLPADVLRSLHFLTRLPLPNLAYKPFSDLIAALPFASLILALGMWIIAQGLWWVWGAAPALAAGLLLAAQTALTGALHDDALADTADGLGGGQTKDHKLTIMRDSRIGSYGMAATVLSFGLRWAAWSALAPSLGLFLSVWLLSRWACLPSMAWQSAARASGAPESPAQNADPQSKSNAKPAENQGGQATQAGQGSRQLVIITGLVVALVVSLATSPLVLLALVPAAGLAWMAQRQLGGVTGDIYGAQIMLTEIAVLLIWAAWQVA